MTSDYAKSEDRAEMEWSIDFQELVDQTPVAIIVRDLTGRVLYCNRAAAGLYGYDSPEDLNGTTLEDAMETEFAAHFRQNMMPAMLAGPYTERVLLPTTRRGLIHVNGYTNRFTDAGGNPIALYSILIDVTELVQAEQALAESRKLLSSVQDAIPANLAVIDPDGNIIAVNERWRQFARENGDPDMAKTCEGRNYLDACRRASGPFSEGAIEALEDISAILRGEAESFELEYPCPSASGDRFFFMQAAALSRQQGGAVVVHTDITARKRAEEALLKKEEEFRSIAENLDAVIVRIDRNMLPIAITGHTEKVLGYSIQEIQRHPALFREIICPQDIDSVWELLARTAELGMPQTFDLRMRRRTGETCWLRGTLTPVFDTEGNLTHYDGVGLDVTRLKHAEEARRESEERLRNLVDTADALIFRVSIDNIPIVLFGRVQEISGYAISELLESAELWRNCIHPDDRERVRREYHRIGILGKPGSIELRIVSSAGVIRWIHTQVSPHYDAHGALVYFDGVGVDITERIEAHEREAMRASRMAVLTDVSQQFASSLDAQHILDIATRQLGGTFDGLVIGITIDPAQEHLRHLSIYCRDDHKVEQIDRSIRRTGLTPADLIEPSEAAARLVPELRDMSSIARSAIEAAGFADTPRPIPGMVAPVYAGSEAVGVIITASLDGSEFDDEDLWFVSEMASHASAALANAIIYKRQTQIAEALQRSLIPAAPEICCLDIATLYAPAPGESRVGGDFLDVFRCDYSKIGLVVGDVSGKGLSAAIHTAEAKYMLRAIAHENTDPSDVMRKLNSALFAFLPEETFVTLVYCLLDANEHTVTWASAGHEVGIILCRGEKRTRLLAPTGPVLGIMDAADYTSRREILDLDDLLVLYTDGITDVRINGERFGFDRLRETILASPEGDARELMDHIMARVRSYGPTKQTDDQVVMVVRPLNGSPDIS